MDGLNEKNNRTGSTRQPDEPSLIAMYHGSNEQFVVLDKLL